MFSCLSMCWSWVGGRDGDLKASKTQWEFPDGCGGQPQNFLERNSLSAIAHASQATSSLFSPLKGFHRRAAGKVTPPLPALGQVAPPVLSPQAFCWAGISEKMGGDG